MNKKRWMISLLLGIVFLAISYLYDNSIVKIISSLRTPLLDEIFMGFTFLSSKIIILPFLIGLFLIIGHKRKWVLPLGATLFISIALGFLAKVGFGRLRPYQTGLVNIPEVFMQLDHNTWNHSFPSMHAIIVFCAIPLLSKEFPKLKKYWISFAVLVAFSRIYFGVHFLSDLIFGAMIGLLIGQSVVLFEEKYRLGEKINLKIFGKTK